MAERGESLWKKFRRAVFQRHRYLPPPVSKRKKDQDDEDTKREAKRIAEEAARKVEHEASQTNLSPTVVKSSEAKLKSIPENEGKTVLRQLGPDLPTAGVTNARIVEILTLYHERRTKGIPENSESLKQLYTQILETITDPNVFTQPDTERDLIRATILSPLRSDVAEHEQKERESALESQRKQAKLSEQRYSVLVNVVVESGERDGQKADEDDFLADREIRNRAYDEIFANADAKPNQPFQQAFNILTDGEKERIFLEDLRSVVQNINNITQEAAARHYAERNGVSLAEARTAILADADKLKGERGSIQDEIKEDLNRYTLDRQVREVLHNANYVLELPNVKAEQLYDFIDPFGSNLVDFVQRTPGVRDMMNIYEMQLRQAMAENDGYLRPEMVQRFVRTHVDENGRQRAIINSPDVETRTKELFKKYVEGRAVYTRDDTNKKREYTRPADQQFKDWEIERLFTTAKGMLVLSMRMLSLAAESKIPENANFTSLYLQDVIQNYAPFTHLLAKYHVPSDKALGVLLTEPDRDKMFGGLARKPWMTKRLEHVKHVLEDGGPGARAILDGKLGEYLQIRRQNTGLCGDAYGFNSWRVGEDPDKVTGSEQLLKVGRKRMRVLVGEDPADATIGATLSPQAQAIYNGLNEGQKEQYLKEYGNWIGTGLRFEKLRPDMAFEKDEAIKKKAIEKGKHIIGRIVDLQPGRIYLKSYKIQTRLKDDITNLTTMYGDTALPKEKRPAALMQKIQNNLLFLESKMYQYREDLLSRGFSFDGIYGEAITLEEVKAMIDLNGITLPHPEAWDATDEFRNLIRADFDDNKESKGSWEREAGDASYQHGHQVYRTERVGHYGEFIDGREYNHGFTLWSGDAPVDEFNMSAVGPTGAFSRRARENKSIGEANVMISKLLSDIKYIRTPDQLFGHLTGIYSKIADWDATMAKEVVTWLSESVLKFYAASGPSKIPIIGGILKTFPDQIRGIVTLPGHLPLIGKFTDKYVDRAVKGTVRGIGKIPVVGKSFENALEDASLYITGSFAQRMYGKRAPVWHASETRYFIKNLMEEHGYIKPHQAKTLVDRMTARTHDWFLDVGGQFAPVLAIVILFWLLKEASEDT
ncbi:MAG: hypothetical protein Q8Q49_03250 [bacterium]|nr:hypothetical protein [bacterium]